jgi:hypothetical protein
MCQKHKKLKRLDNKRHKEFKDSMKEELRLHLEWHYRVFEVKLKNEKQFPYEFNGWTFEDFIKEAKVGHFGVEHSYSNRITINYDNASFKIFDTPPALAQCYFNLNQRTDTFIQLPYKAKPEGLTEEDRCR